MYKEFFQHSSLLGFPLFSLILFIFVFAVVVVMAFVRYRGPRLEQHSNMPLQDDLPPPHRAPLEE